MLTGPDNSYANDIPEYWYLTKPHLQDQNLLTFSLAAQQADPRSPKDGGETMTFCGKRAYWTPVRLLFWLLAVILLGTLPTWAQVECHPHDLAINRSPTNVMVASATTVQCVVGAILHLGADCQFNIGDAGSGVRYLSGPAPIEVLSPPGFVGLKSPGSDIIPGSLEPIFFGVFTLKFNVAGTYVLRGFPTGFGSAAAGVVDVTVVVCSLITKPMQHEDFDLTILSNSATRIAF